MNTEFMLHYLSELERNNDREWFHANKEQYKTAVYYFEDLVQSLMTELGKTDENILGFKPKDLTFKLMRDTRFSHDKSPYLPAFRAHISSKGKRPVPVGYYIMIRPDNRSFLGGGLFADVFPDATAMVRQYISTHGQQWQEVITAPSFVKYFTVKGATLKNVPRGYDADHPQADYLKMKSWYLEYPINDNEIREEKFLSAAVNIFLAMRPFNSFLNAALKDFEMPKR